MKKKGKALVTIVLNTGRELSSHTISYIMDDGNICTKDFIHFKYDGRKNIILSSVLIECDFMRNGEPVNVVIPRTLVKPGETVTLGWNTPIITIGKI